MISRPYLLSQFKTKMNILDDDIEQHNDRYVEWRLNEYRALMKDNREAITNGQLLLMSVVNPYSTFRAYNAIDRNKYIYASSQIAFIVSSDKDKGGTWEGAIENKKLSLVDAYVRIDDHIPEGNHHLVKNGLLPFNLGSIYNNSNALTNLIAKSITDKEKYSKDNENIAKVLDNHSIHQLSIFEMPNNTAPTINTGTGDNDIPSNLLHVEEKNEVSPHGNNMEQGDEVIDLYNIIIPNLINFVREKRRLNEIASHFSIVPTQMKAWLERAIDEGKVVKDKHFYTVSPDKY